MHTNSHLRSPALAYRALGSERRLYILELLSERKYTCGELSDKLSITMPAISKHLNLLIRAGFAKGKREGASVKFKIENDYNIEMIKDTYNLLTKRFKIVDKPY